MNRRGSADTGQVRCAIYTRVSTAGQAQQEFSSVHAQREACEAYVKSQVGRGWILLDEYFDDAGFTGSNIERPALKRLLSKTDAGHVDCVIVYRFDRISRSMLDFTQLLAGFEKRNVEFVSVSESLDTSSPTGRFARNILMSAAELEREIIAERTRDKVLAARRRGKWTGGPPPLGYSLRNGKLIPHPDEAEQVQAIYQLYLEHGTLTGTVDALRQRGWTTKGWKTKKGRYHKGRPFNVNSLRRLLTNPVYVGQVRCGEETYEGEHEGILDQELFNRVQALLAENRNDGGRKARNRHEALLKGLLRCSHCDAAMTPSATHKGSRRYRYYVCTYAQKHGWEACPTKSVNAHEIEKAVVDEIRETGKDPALVQATVEAAEDERERQLALLATEMRTTEKAHQRLEEEQRQLAVTAGGKGNAADAASKALEETARDLVHVEERLRALHDQHDALSNHDVDAEELRQLLEQFDPLWQALHPYERVKVVQLLIEHVHYDAEADELTITFRADGLRPSVGGAVA